MSINFGIRFTKIKNMTKTLSPLIKALLKKTMPNEAIHAFRLLNKNQKYKLIIVILVQSSLSLLDLLGVAAVGLVAALSVSGVQSKTPGNRVENVLSFMNLENVSFQQQVAIIGIMAASIFLFRTYLSIILSRKILFFLSRCGAVISGNISAKLFSQYLPNIQKISSQETLYALTHGVTAITLGLLGSLTTMFADGALLLIITGGLFLVDPIMALISIIFFLLIAGVLHLSMTKRAGELGEISAELSIISHKKILEILNSFREALVKNRRFHYVNEIRDSRMNLANITAEYSFMPNISKYIIEASLIVGAVIFAATQFLLQDATHAIANLGIFMAAGSRLAPAVLRLQSSALRMKISLGEAQPTFELLRNLENLKTIPLNTHKFFSIYQGFDPTIKVSNLNFYHEGKSDPALINVNCDISQGELVAVTGPSGAGKTTFVDCIIGAYETDSKSILISGKSPLDAIETWPGAIGYVPQDVMIIEGTIRENIIFGFSKEEISDDLVIEALKKAHAYEFVTEMPNGIHTYVGDRGTKLSGGQRQRLGIARALVSKPKLLILDEATSSLDGKSEADISDSINEFRGEVTTLIIAHRLSTIRAADKVIYMNKGKIEFIGTFDEVRKNVPEFDNQAKLMGL